MPRVDLSTHYRRYSLLRLLWLDAPQAFALLTPVAQWELHELYQPSRHVDLAEFELHVAGLARAKPSLASRVGKHYKKLETIYLALKEQGISLTDDPAQFKHALIPLLQANQERPVASKKAERGPPSTGPSHSNKHVLVTGIARPEIDLAKLASALLALAKQKEEQKQRSAALPVVAPSDLDADLSQVREDGVGADPDLGANPGK